MNDTQEATIYCLGCGRPYPASTYKPNCVTHSECCRRMFAETEPDMAKLPESDALNREVARKLQEPRASAQYNQTVHAMIDFLTIKCHERKIEPADVLQLEAACCWVSLQATGMTMSPSHPDVLAMPMGTPIFRQDFHPDYYNSEKDIRVVLWERYLECRRVTQMGEGEEQVEDDRMLVGVLYQLMRDHVTPGQLELAVSQSRTHKGHTTVYTNSDLARYCQKLADEIIHSSVPHEESEDGTDES